MQKIRSHALLVGACGGWLVAIGLTVVVALQMTGSGQPQDPPFSRQQDTMAEKASRIGRTVAAQEPAPAGQSPWQWDSENALEEGDIAGSSKLVRAILGGKEFGRELPVPKPEDVEELKRRVSAFANSPRWQSKIEHRDALVEMYRKPGLGPLIDVSLIRLTDWRKYHGYQWAIKERRAPEEVLRHIVRACPSGSGRLQAATILAGLGHEQEMVEEMIAYLDLGTAHDWGINRGRYFVIRWLGERSGDAVGARLTGALHDNDPAVRVTAMFTLMGREAKFGTGWRSQIDREWWQETFRRARWDRMLACQAWESLLDESYLKDPDLVELAISTLRAGPVEVVVDGLPTSCGTEPLRLALRLEDVAAPHGRALDWLGVLLLPRHHDASRYSVMVFSRNDWMSVSVHRAPFMPSQTSITSSAVRSNCSPATMRLRSSRS